MGLLLSLIPSFIFYQDLFKFFLTLKHRPAISIFVNRYTFIFVMIAGLSFHIHWDTQANFKMPENWLINIKKQCPKMELGDVDPEAINFKKVVTSFCIIGSYFGNVFEQKFMASRKYNHFNETSVWTSIQRLLLCITFALPTQLIKDIPNLFMKQQTVEVLIVFKYFLQPAIQGFVLFAFSKTISIYFGLANLRESEETIAGHDKELLSIMCGTEINAEVYKHNKKDGECKHNPNQINKVANGSAENGNNANGSVHGNENGVAQQNGNGKRFNGFLLVKNGKNGKRKND